MGNSERLVGVIYVYSNEARKMINSIGWKFLELARMTHYADDIFSSVDELIKNAFKSNYKFLLIFNRIKKRISMENPGIDNAQVISSSYEILKDRNAFDRFSAEILSSEDISSIVRQILNEESKHLQIKNRVYDEKRDFTEEDKKVLAGLTNLVDIKKAMKENGIKIMLKFEIDNDFLYIEVTNTAPITSSDLRRIYEKRDEYRTYRDAGKEHEFFLNNIDTSESGFGFGYAKIDSHLSNIGFASESTIRIISASNTTVMLTFPLSRKEQ